ncbi:MAG: di-heme-cytochrome C peroxidase, partial [Sphingomonadaceae bacterium]
REAPAGALEGQRKGFVGSGPRLETPAPVANMLSTMVVGTLVGRKEEVVRVGAEVFLGVAPRPPIIEETVAVDEKTQRLAACLAATDAEDPAGIVGYKARPLNGIWATAPYLHNGSVPTLHDLLLPPDQRPARFWLGTREYDPVRVGYRTDREAPGQRFEFVTKDEAGRWIDGNGAQGHVYGVDRLSERERAALLEYMKTL